MLLKKVLSLGLFSGLFLANSLCGAAPLMVDKNLFSQDRKPPSPESAVAASQPNRPNMPVSNIQLDGVIIQGDSKKAIIRLKSQVAGPDKKKSSPFVTVREGQQVGDFRVTKIEPKNISLEKDGQTHIVSLFSENKVSTPAAVPPPPPPVQPAELPQNQPPGFISPNQPGVPPQVAGRRGPQGQIPVQPGFMDPGAIPPNMPENIGQMPQGAQMEPPMQEPFPQVEED